MSKMGNRKKQVNSFYTITSKLKIKYNSDHGEVPAIITYDEEILEIFGAETVRRVESKRNS